MIGDKASDMQAAHRVGVPQLIFLNEDGESSALSSLDFSNKIQTFLSLSDFSQTLL